MDLTIESGAYDGTFEFGGLSLNNLTIKDGAANVELAFSEPNLVEMSTFRYETGASDVKMSGLANANFSIFDFSVWRRRLHSRFFRRVTARCFDQDLERIEQHHCRRS